VRGRLLRLRDRLAPALVIEAGDALGDRLEIAPERSLDGVLA